MKIRTALAVALAVALSAGCTQNKDREAAYKRWYGVRAKMLNGVAAEHLKTGQLDKARNKAQEALALDPECVPAGTVLSKVYLEQGYYKLAADKLAELRELEPESAELAYLEAVANERNGKLENALKGYRLAHALDSKDLSGIVAAGEVLMALGRKEEARRYIDGYIGEAGSEPALFELAGRLAMMDKDYPQAVKHFRRARDEDSASVRYCLSLAEAEFLAGQYEDVLDTLQTLVLRKDYEAPTSVHNMLGDCYMALNMSRKARDAYFMAQRAEGSQAEVHANIAKASLAMGDMSRAVLSARRALQEDGGDLEASLVLGYALLAQGKTESALKALRLAEKEHSDSGTLQCLLGRGYAAAGDEASARICYRKAMALDGDDSLGKALLADGSAEVEGAIRH